MLRAWQGQPPPGQPSGEAILGDALVEGAAERHLLLADDRGDARRVLVCIGHDEYWSSGQRDAVDEFLDNGGRVANGFRVCLTRDLSRIEVDLDFGNIPFDEADAKKAFGMAMDNFDWSEVKSI